LENFVDQGIVERIEIGMRYETCGAGIVDRNVGTNASSQFQRVRERRTIRHRCGKSTMIAAGQSFYEILDGNTGFAILDLVEKRHGCPFTLREECKLLPP
jgi:hypothetical protein